MGNATDREFSRHLHLWLEGLETFATPVEASKFMDWMREHEPELLENWLDRHLLDLVKMAMERRLRGDRTRARVRSRARAFQRAAGTLRDTGDATPLGRFRRETFAVDSDHTRKVVARMTGADHLFVAENYGRSGRNLLMLQAFHRAVARRVGDLTTEEVFSEEEYDELYLRIVG